MKLTPQNRTGAAFTMVEMVGVLGVIAILAAMLTPKIFSAINDARLSAAVGSLESVKSATVSYYSKYGTLPTNNNFDMLLVSEQFLERPFECRVGSGDLVQGVATDGGPSSNGYKLDGSGVATATASTVVECLLSNVAIADAQDLSKRMDGDSLSAVANVATNDLRGRVEYSFTSGSGTVYIYLGHR
jgi:general secretion pathway protein G